MLSRKTLTIIIFVILGLLLLISGWVLKGFADNSPECGVHQFSYFAKNKLTGDLKWLPKSMALTQKSIVISPPFEIYRVCQICKRVERLEWIKFKNLKSLK